METHPREVKKAREVAHLVAVPPEETLRMGVGLVEFGRRFSEAADRARL